jgi:ABC-type nickel/cobalt efflux system permease component RcnA
MLRYLSTALLTLLLLGCSQSGTNTPPTITIADIQNEIKLACGYAPTVESIVAVASTITSALNPAAGATATVLVSTGTAITNQICQAVQAKTAATQLQAKKGAEAPAPQTLDVVVNGVVVHGTWSPPAGTETKP